MAAQTIPKVGEAYLENAMRYLTVTYGDSTSDVPQETTISDSEAGNVIPAAIFSWGAGGITIYGVTSRVITAFKAGTGISVGTDSDASASAAAYWLSTDKVAATIATVTHPITTSWLDIDASGSATLANGITPMYYSGTGTIEVTFQAGDSDQTVPDTGQVEFGVWYTYGVQ